MENVGPGGGVNEDMSGGLLQHRLGKGLWFEGLQMFQIVVSAKDP
jgi:hypothetical protein